MGRIEVHCAGTWGSVQASGWDIKDATVACRQLVYHSASLSCKPSREASTKKGGRKRDFGLFSFPPPSPQSSVSPLPFPVSLPPLPPFCACLVAQSLYGAFFHIFLVNAFRRPGDKSGYPYMSSDPTLSLTLYQADLAAVGERQLTTARANQIIGLTNRWATNWAPEVVFSPFRALSSRQMTFPFCCYISLMFLMRLWRLTI